MQQPLSSGAEITKAPLLRGISAFGLPLVAAMMLAALFNLVDLVIVARLPRPEVAVAAVTISSLLNSLPTIIFNGIVNAIIALVARHHGLGNRREANQAAEQGMLVTVGLSALFGIPMWIYAREIVVAFGAKGDVIPGATAYLAIMSAGLVTMFVLLAVTGVMRAAGNSLLPMALIVGANVLNVVLDFWLVLGPPQMGVAGAAWGTVLSRGIFCLIGVVVLWRGFAGLVVRRFAWHSKTVWSILRIGIPSCVQWFVRMVSYMYTLHFVAVAAPLAAVGLTEAQAAFGVGLRLDSLALFGGFGWGAAAATFVGQNLGRGLPERAERSTWIALGLNMMMMLIFAGAYVLFADPLLGIMGFDVAEGMDVGAVRDIGRTYLYVSSAGYVFLAVAVVISQALAGAGATKFPFFLETLAYGVIGIPLTWWVAAHADTVGLRALWAVPVFLHLAVAVAYMLWFRLGLWSRKELQ